MILLIKGLGDKQYYAPVAPMLAAPPGPGLAEVEKGRAWLSAPFAE